MFQFRSYKNEAFTPNVLWPHAEWHKLGVLTSAETETTPVAAAYILAHCNNRNRHLTESRARYFGRLMGMSKWFLTGEALLFDEEGEGLSVQHRLQGCVYSGKSFKSVVTLDVPMEGADWVDNVRAKTVADRLGAEGVPHYNNLASILRIMYCWQRTGQIGRLHRYQFDMEQADATMEAFPSLDKAAAWPSHNKQASTFFRGPGVTGSLWWIMEQVGDGLGTEFLNMASSNRIPTEAKWDVVAKLNKQLGGWRQGARIEDVAALTLKAWNIFREERKIQTLVMKPDEKYPRVHGWKYDPQGRPVECGSFKLPRIEEPLEEA